MQSAADSPDSHDVTAVAMTRPLGWQQPAARPRAATSTLTIPWREPSTWTVGIVLATAAVIAARHPLAHLIGTEVELAPLQTASVGAQMAAAPVALPTTPAIPVAPAPTHAPRDPFAPLTGAALPAQPAAPAAAAAAAAKPAVTPAATGSAGSPACRVHVVRHGESLWSIAGRSWPAVYAENKGRVGADASLLRVGTRLCLPR